jgi:antitoxin (DNA-binding transcriptional repressor) of toxin-antitoxin stability system
MRQVRMHEAKTHLSRLIAAVEKGEEVVIMRGEVAVARLLPMEPRAERQPGRYKGRVYLDQSFFEPLPEDEISAWEGR